MRMLRLLGATALLATALPAQTPPPGIRKYLEKPGFHWKCAALPHIDFCFPEDMAADPEITTARRDLELILAKTLSFGGAGEYAPRVHIFLTESYSRVREFIGSYAAGASVPTDHVVVFANGHPEALAHELHHEVFTHLWGRSEHWIAEGFAAYAAEPTEVDNQFHQLVARNKSLPLEWMVNSYWNASMYSSGIIYPEVGSFVKFLKERYGVNRLRQLWRGGAQSIPKVLHQSLSDPGRHFFWQCPDTQLFSCIPSHPALTCNLEVACSGIPNQPHRTPGSHPRPASPRMARPHRHSRILQVVLRGDGIARVPTRRAR